MVRSEQFRSEGCELTADTEKEGRSVARKENLMAVATDEVARPLRMDAC